MAIVKCTNQACGKEFDEEKKEEGTCAYHPGGPVFHEGLKSWSCCKDTNKPVLEFDAFMKLPPCTTGTHTSVPRATPSVPAQKPDTSNSAPAMTSSKDGVETYGSVPPPSASSGSGPKIENQTPVLPTPAPAPAPTAAIVGGGKQGGAEEKKEVKEEEDDVSLPVPEGARCKRTACGAAWEGEEVSRGEGEKATCRYHPQSAVFHEGSKGYLCCKRRVLEFDEFIKIKGCKEGKHLFVGQKKDETKEEFVNCRVDHYQTPTQVHVSAFAKNADKQLSKVTFTDTTLHLSLHLPSLRRIEKTITLYGPISPADSSYRILGTKIEITLTKPKAASWPVLELPPAGTELPPGYALTFGVRGRTGTVGGKEIVLAEEEVGKRA
ncbi:CORD and CS domain-containing protein [Cryptococcus wingfieldii CBS 7118]|uniref:CORD and CS domain-containing protein n=1 Tax=Cryptococcus wingfieldii CBS 7118 TaxID=1295528 RepID=A0A1E3J9D8_9TREE|nr:CORD and CS domain-containing protein [Cryptococcus wingfieldii CBS 7118]ODN97467.1 CORD and CS domain-containing protein [Cryptococcus wingfieldii CBS 7118]